MLRKVKVGEMKVEHKCCTHNFNDHVGFQVFIVCHTYFDNFGCTIAIALVTAIHSLSTSLLYHYYGLFSSWHAFGPFQPLFQPHSTKPTKAEFSYQSTRTQWLKIIAKSLIQHCERSELCLHFEWTKILQVENLKVAVKQCYQIGQF